MNKQMNEVAKEQMHKLTDEERQFSNNWDPIVQTGMGSPCNALERQFSNKWDQMVPTSMGTHTTLERQLSNTCNGGIQWSLLLRIQQSHTLTEQEDFS